MRSLLRHMRDRSGVEKICSRLAFAFWLLLVALPLAMAAAPAPRAELEPEIRAFVQEMAERHGFDRAALEKTFRETRRLDSIIRAMDAPATALPWHEFRLRHITDARIKAGLQFWAENQALLEKAAAEFRLPAEMVVATIGVETIFGLAYRHHPRARCADDTGFQLSPSCGNFSAANWSSICCCPAKTVSE